MHGGKGECVPLLRLKVGLYSEHALDAYTVGNDGVVSVKEVEALFGSRWRFLCRDPDKKNRHVHLYSTRAPLYRAFCVQCSPRGAAAGVDQVLSEIKNKYKGVRSSKAVCNQAKAVYPKSRGSGRQCHLCASASLSVILTLCFVFLRTACDNRSVLLWPLLLPHAQARRQGPGIS